ncbi:two component regulator propeller domain protein [Leptothrix cholodnii SP-6]|uniref:Two component regulator propeller domain protein n=1 Tax=Leptothrix cholodnii (strain ATCC 51168 / LMG 8142 / SP-6) TaxID=395495 RepID=B1XXP7_LEPCP|nr:two-component regulator propeller domain-containing protein [Leptothrix cholodnii]ACB36366.1 two component regulator propeller domain protein [Leptothrix cholodnii SP-6]
MVRRFRLFAATLIGLGVAFGAWAQAARPAPAAAAAASAAAQKFTHFRVGNKNVKRLFVDGDVVWVGTSGGVVRYDTRSDDYKLFDVKSGLLSNGVFHVGKLDGRIVVGTYGGGLSLLDPVTEKWQTYNIPEGLGDAFVYDVLKAKNGDVWIATWSGVNRVRGGRLDDRSQWELHTVESTRGGLPNDWVYGLAEGRDGEIWLGTEGGLAQFKDGTWQNWNHARGLGADYERVKDQVRFKTDPAKVSEHHARQKQEMGLQDIQVAYNPNYMVSLAVDAQGVVWAGTWGGGLSRFDGTTWTSYTVAEGLPGNHVFMLHIDPLGVLWVGTDNGLAKMNGGRFEVLTTVDGLFSNTIFSMTTALDGTLWVGSFGGVARLKPF